MKKIIFLKGMLSVVMLFIASLTISAAKPGDNLVHNTEEVNGVIISETVFKMDGNMLTNYMKHNYKYDTNQQRTEDESQKMEQQQKTVGKITSASVIFTEIRALLPNIINEF
mgnify:CR=1 FL=1